MSKSVVPNLFIPGAAKCGTSSLFYFLSSHPDIGVSKLKEPHTYSVSWRYKNRFCPGNRYSFPELFRGEAPQKKFRLEASTTYFPYPDTPRRIYEDNSEARFIVPVRDPIDRIISHYRWLFSLGHVHKSFREEVEDWADRAIDPDQSIGGNYKWYLQCSRYGDSFSNYLKWFPPDRFCFVDSYDLSTNRQATLNRICDFLGIHTINTRLLENKNETAPRRVQKPAPIVELGKRLFPRKIRQMSVAQTLKKALVSEKVVCAPDPSPADLVWLRELLRADVAFFIEQTGFDTRNWKTFSP